MGDLKAGIYKHYKGGLFLALGVARHSETREVLVAYVPLGVKEGPRILVRPYNMFFESVTIDGVVKPRFDYVGETPPPEMAVQYDKLSGYTGGDRVDN